MGGISGCEANLVQESINETDLVDPKSLLKTCQNRFTEEMKKNEDLEKKLEIEKEERKVFQKENEKLMKEKNLVDEKLKVYEENIVNLNEENIQLCESTNLLKSENDYLNKHQEKLVKNLEILECGKNEEIEKNKIKVEKVEKELNERIEENINFRNKTTLLFEKKIKIIEDLFNENEKLKLEINNLNGRKKEAVDIISQILHEDENDFLQKSISDHDSSFTMNNTEKMVKIENVNIEHEEENVIEKKERSKSTSCKKIKYSNIFDEMNSKFKNIFEKSKQFEQSSPSIEEVKKEVDFDGENEYDEIVEDDKNEIAIPPAPSLVELDTKKVESKKLVVVEEAKKKVGVNRSFGGNKKKSVIDMLREQYCILKSGITERREKMNWD